MRAVPEDASASCLEPPVEVKPPQPKSSARAAPAKRGVYGSLSFDGSIGPFDGFGTTFPPAPGSPRSTLEEDGVILTGKTRIGLVTRRHSMSRLFGPCGAGSSPKSSPKSCHRSNHLTYSENADAREVAKMPRGVKRRESLRRVLQQSRAQSEEALDFAEPPPAPEQSTSNSRPVGGGMKRLHQMRRNSLGAIGRLASSPSLIIGGGSQHQQPQQQRSRRSLLERTTSYRKQDSLRENFNKASTTTNTQSSQRSLATHSQRSLHRSSSGNNNNLSSRETTRGLKRQSSLADLMVDCNTTVSVSNTWASVRRVENYPQKLGEQIILKMMELDPLGARMNMRLESFFSPRFTELCTCLVETIEMIVTLLGPDLDEAAHELAQCGANCRNQGIVTDRLGDAVSAAVDKLLGPEEVTPDMVKAWKIVFDCLRRRLQVPVS